MSRTAYPLKLPALVKAAATRLAKADGVSLNQFIAMAVAENVGVLETAEDFLRRRAGEAKPRDLLKFTREAGREKPGDEDPARYMLRAPGVRTGLRRGAHQGHCGIDESPRPLFGQVK